MDRVAEEAYKCHYMNEGEILMQRFAGWKRGQTSWTKEQKQELGRLGYSMSGYNTDGALELKPELHRDGPVVESTPPVCWSLSGKPGVQLSLL
jgi:hypothetical protein